MFTDLLQLFGGSADSGADLSASGADAPVGPPFREVLLAATTNVAATDVQAAGEGSASSAQVQPSGGYPSLAALIAEFLTSETLPAAGSSGADPSSSDAPLADQQNLDQLVAALKEQHAAATISDAPPLTPAGPADDTSVGVTDETVVSGRTQDHPAPSAEPVSDAQVESALPFPSPDTRRPVIYVPKEPSATPVEPLVSEAASHTGAAAEVVANAVFTQGRPQGSQSDDPETDPRPVVFIPREEPKVSVGSTETVRVEDPEPSADGTLVSQLASHNGTESDPVNGRNGGPSLAETRERETEATTPESSLHRTDGQTRAQLEAFLQDASGSNGVEATQDEGDAPKTGDRPSDSGLERTGPSVASDPLPPSPSLPHAAPVVDPSSEESSPIRSDAPAPRHPDGSAQVRPDGLSDRPGAATASESHVARDGSEGSGRSASIDNGTQVQPQSRSTQWTPKASSAQIDAVERAPAPVHGAQIQSNEQPRVNGEPIPSSQQASESNPVIVNAGGPRETTPGEAGLAAERRPGDAVPQTTQTQRASSSPGTTPSPAPAEDGQAPVVNDSSSQPVAALRSDRVRPGAAPARQQPPAGRPVVPQNGGETSGVARDAAQSGSVDSASPQQAVATGQTSERSAEVLQASGVSTRETQPERRPSTAAAAPSSAVRQNGPAASGERVQVTQSESPPAPDVPMPSRPAAQRTADSAETARVVNGERAPEPDAPERRQAAPAPQSGQDVQARQPGSTPVAGNGEVVDAAGREPLPQAGPQSGTSTSASAAPISSGSGVGAAIDAAPQNGAQQVAQSDLQATIDQLEQNHRISEQIVRSAADDHPGGTSSVTVRLQPEELGEVTIRLVSSEGTLSGDITVQNRAVHEIAQRSIGTLREALANQGVQVDQLQVSVDSQGQAQQDRQAFQELMNQRSGRQTADDSGGSGAPSGQEETPEREPVRNPNAQVDFTA